MGLVSILLLMVAQTNAAPFAFVTLATNDNYVLGALTLISSLRASDNFVADEFDFVALVTDSVSSEARFTLTRFGYIVRRVSTIPCWRGKLDRAVVERFGVTCTKLHCFDLIEFKRLIYIDADSVVFNASLLKLLFTDDVPENVVLRAVPSPSSRCTSSDHDQRGWLVSRDAALDIDGLLNNASAPATLLAADNAMLVEVPPSPEALDEAMFQTALLVGANVSPSFITFADIAFIICFFLQVLTPRRAIFDALRVATADSTAFVNGDLELLNAAFGTLSLALARRYLVAQTSTLRPFVAVRRQGSVVQRRIVWSNDVRLATARVHWADVVVYDFSGPAHLKPWSVVAAQTGVL